MATLNKNELSIADIVKRMNAQGMIPIIAELLDQQNGIVADIPWVQGDTQGGHMSIQRTSLPAFETEVVGEFMESSKSTTAQIIESPETIVGWSVIPEGAAEYGGNVAAKRTSEAIAFAQAANQTVAKRLFYGNSKTAIGQIDGLSSRYNKLSHAVLGDNIINGGGAGADNASIWLILWGPGKVYGWYPKGSPGGLQIVDWGRQVEFSGKKQRVVWKEQWRWKIGVAIDDWRCAVRIANLDRSLAVAGSVDLFNFMIEATHAIPNLAAGRPYFYMDRTMRMALDKRARTDVSSGGQLGYEVVDGRRIERFQGIEIKVEDALGPDEAPVPA